MNKKWFIGALFLFCFIVAGGTLQAGQCDDIFSKAAKMMGTANESYKNKDYAKAEKLYLEASGLYKQSSAMKDCDSPKLAGYSRDNADSCSFMAIECRRVIDSENRYAAEKKLNDDYNRARDMYNQAKVLAARSELGKAASSFEDAAAMWDRIATASPESEGGKRASQSASQARVAAKQLRDYMNVSLK